MKNKTTKIFKEDVEVINELLESTNNLDLVSNLLNNIVKTEELIDYTDTSKSYGINFNTVIPEISKELLINWINNEEDYLHIKTFFNGDDNYRIRVCLRRDDYSVISFNVEVDELE